MYLITQCTGGLKSVKNVGNTHTGVRKPSRVLALTPDISMVYVDPLAETKIYISEESCKIRQIE